MAVLVLFLMGTGWNRNLLANETDANKDRLEPYARWIKTPEGKALLGFIRSTVYTLLHQKTVESIAENPYPWIQYPVGVFITAMDKRKVRVCVGVFTPTEPTLEKELIRQCTRLIIDDPRHPPIALRVGPIAIRSLFYRRSNPHRETGRNRYMEKGDTHALEWPGIRTASWRGENAVMGVERITQANPDSVR